MRRALLLGLMIMSCACTGKWVQEGKSGIETRQDSAECADRILGERRELNEATVRECMESKGYRLRTEQKRGEARSPSEPAIGQNP
jgi:hypothetical protein